MPATLARIMPGSIRLYVSAALTEGGTIDASPAQARYLTSVMRRGPGDRVLLFNGRDGEFSARIETTGRSLARLRVEQRTRPQAGDPNLWLAFALLKRDATDLVVQKATELGVAELLPVISAHGNTHRMNAARMTAIAIEAAEQSERLTVPAVHSPRKLAALLADWPAERRLFVAMERSAAPRLGPAEGPRALLVGPEGGFAPPELDVLCAHPFVTPVSLGPRVLRAETACIAGLALLQAADCR
ncbi:MAG TPA: 16S rRNA (uracil(1498)-N(3))-methyltransferase [Acetobacteraceae bacterium]|jgi:16S rRNA (uracil1498-N3)-methyltransferase